MAGSKDIAKENLSNELHRQSGSAIGAYRAKVLGSSAGFLQLLRFEIAAVVCQNLGGGLGYLLRKKILAPLFKSCGKSLILGKGIVLRKPGHIELGSNVAIDDYVMLDGCSEDVPAIQIGDNVIISKACVIQAKTGPLEIGDNCDIGAHTIISSISKITLAPSVLIAGNCYIGGARYHLEDLTKPIMNQGIYSRGPVSIGEGSWVGASATILDGVTIGKGCVIGAGALVTADIPDYGVAVGVPAKVIRTRKT
ncbi:MAG TPA: acyltransferase [Desulfobacterales bacterium]|nr:acyltransferase [Desulfobacterales bacterium]